VVERGGTSGGLSASLPLSVVRVAIIGGGASGLSAAWSLDPVHDVTLFEREPILGGHIRTLGGNVRCAGLPMSVHLDAGVIEFDRTNFTAFHAFMDALGVAYDEPEGAGATCLYTADGRALRTPFASHAEHSEVALRGVDFMRILPSMLRLRRFLRHVEPLGDEDLAASPIGPLLGQGDFGLWVRSLLMYAYSMPYDEVSSVSAALAVPMLREFLKPNRWTRIVGGTSRYVECVASSLRGEIRVSARIHRVVRDESAVRLVHEDGSEERFDAVVLALPPHRMLALLADPSETEHAVLGAFEGGTATTIVHTDVGLYERRGAHYFTEFDLFELPGGKHGYNAYLNRLAGLPTHEPPHYSLAFGLESEIEPTRIVHRQQHDVAFYSTGALQRRADLVRINGERRTYYAGAFLGDGLHEGAIRSGFAVGAMLGGRIV